MIRTELTAHPGTVSDSAPSTVKLSRSTPRDVFLHELSAAGLLDHDTVRHVVTDPANASLNGYELARRLIHREAVTAFQANRLLTGRGADLVLGSYWLLERLGRGGMGEVYKARHRRLGHIVAVKVLYPHLVRDPQAAYRFRREIEAAARLDHPHIVKALDAEEADGVLFLVMEYLQGVDLKKLVEDIGPLPIDMACHCIHQAALGLQYAHDQGVVHRDMKPSNIFLRSRYDVSRSVPGKRVLCYRGVKLLDLGLARFLTRPSNQPPDRAITRIDQIMGTPDFMSPEQARDSRVVDTRSDLYSLGASLYYCLTGQPPFPDGSELEKLLSHQTADPVPVETLRPDVPPPLAGLVRWMMAKDPANRPPRASVVAAALRQWRKPPTVVLKDPPRMPETTPPDAEASHPLVSPSTLHFVPHDAQAFRDQVGRSISQRGFWYLLGVTIAGFALLLTLLFLKAIH